VTSIDSTLAPHERNIEERFVRASGPGGQNVNKVASAVELRFDVGSSSLPPSVKSRLTALAGSRMTIEGVLVLDSREHRTQGQNREAARVRARSNKPRCGPRSAGHEAEQGRKQAATHREARAGGAADRSPRRRGLARLFLFAAPARMPSRCSFVAGVPNMVSSASGASAAPRPVSRRRRGREA
jgi:ribosome-associated protein